MSEQNGIQVPVEPSFDDMAFQGSLQQLLQDNLGSLVTVDFLIGTGSLTSRQGVLFAVGTSYIVLYEASSGQYTVGDLYAIKFVTFYAPGAPGPQSQPAAPSFAPAPYGQAAYAHVRRQEKNSGGKAT